MVGVDSTVIELLALLKYSTVYVHTVVKFSGKFKKEAEDAEFAGVQSWATQNTGGVRRLAVQGRAESVLA